MGVEPKAIPEPIPTNLAVHRSVKCVRPTADSMQYPDPIVRAVPMMELAFNVVCSHFLAVKLERGSIRVEAKDVHGKVFDSWAAQHAIE